MKTSIFSSLGERDEVHGDAYGEGAFPCGEDNDEEEAGISYAEEEEAYYVEDDLPYEAGGPCRTIGRDEA